MAEKAYPPIIDNKLPPIILSKTENNSTILNITIPFEFNGFVSKDNLIGISIKFSEAMSNYEIDSVQIRNISAEGDSSYIDLTNKNVYLKNYDIKNKLKKGQFYKIQLAFIVNNELGYYSSYGVSKCLSSEDFSIGIVEFNQKDSNTQIYNLTEVTGQFESKDLGETVINYEFNVYNNKELVESSGVQVHNNSLTDKNNITQNSRITQDTFTITKELETYKEYEIEYKVYTTNGYVCSYKNGFSTTNLFPLNFAGDIVAEVDNDNACSKVYLHPSKLLGKFVKESVSMAGVYKLFRSSNKSNFKTWEHLANFNLPNLKFIESQDGEATFSDQTMIPKEIVIDGKSYPAYLVYVDYLLEQGVQYKYAISVIFDEDSKGSQQSSKIITKNSIFVNYETAFLYDKDYQLAIKYNPKVSSLKTTKLEQKVDTLGGVYPYFSRNYNTNYKDFPIAGLISILMDDQQLFNQGINWYNDQLFKQQNNSDYEAEIGQFRQNTWSSEDESNFKNYRNTDLVGENFKAERDFKLKILDWLNNGQPKVFKSSAEGNYIVRLMNVSLSPTDSLGRMLHSFTCNAYEIAPYTLKGLIDNNLFSIDTKTIGGIQKDIIVTQSNESPYVFDLSRYDSITRIDFFNFPFDAEIKLYNSQNTNTEPKITFYGFDENFVIVNDIQYDIKDIKLITSSEVIRDDNQQIISRLEVYTDAYASVEFNQFEKLLYDKILIKQYISESYDKTNNNSIVFKDDKFNCLTDDKLQSTYIQKLRIQKRPIIEDFSVEEILEDEDITLEDIAFSFYPKRVLPNPLCIYEIENEDQINEYWTQDIYGIVHKYSEIDNSFKISNFQEENEIEGELGLQEKYEANELEDINSITLGNGLYCELSYPTVKIIYLVEQPWRKSDEEDNAILCGYSNTPIFYTDAEEEDNIYYMDINFDSEYGYYQNLETLESSDKIYIGLNCYTLLSKDDYPIDDGINTYIINQKNKQRENGRYLSDRAFIIEHLNQVRDKKELVGI